MATEVGNRALQLWNIKIIKGQPGTRLKICLFNQISGFLRIITLLRVLFYQQSQQENQGSLDAMEIRLGFRAYRMSPMSKPKYLISG